MKKQLIIVVTLVAVAGTTAGFGSNGLVSAQSLTAGSSSTAAHRKVTPRIRRARVSARINQAVRDGVITASQKSSLEKELATLRSERRANLSTTSTPAQRQAERAKLKSELQSWARSNSNVPLRKIFPKLVN